MNKIPANVQHVSIFRIENVYLIGVLYDFESDNQEGSLDIIIQGNSISFGIDPAHGPKSARTAITSAAVHIVSESNAIPVFNVNKGDDVVISVPVFSLGAQDRSKVAYELSDLLSAMRQSLLVVPNVSSGLPGDVAEELGGGRDGFKPAREWGWNGW